MVQIQSSVSSNEKNLKMKTSLSASLYFFAAVTAAAAGAIY